MNNWVTSVACIMVLLVFIAAGFMIASDWIGMAIQQVRFGRGMYEEFKVEKQRWERNRASQEGTAPEAGGIKGSSAISPDDGPNGRP